MLTINRFFQGLWIAVMTLGWAGALNVAAEEPTFSASVDRGTISQDESVSLKFVLRVEAGSPLGGGLGGRMPRPAFLAPDFEVINEFTGVFMESSYINGRFTSQSNRQLTLVLRPKKTGDLKISNIALDVGGRTLKAPDLRVEVSPSGWSTVPPRTYGGGGVGLRGAGKKASGASYFVRAEIDKTKVFQGEQVIISYFLYSRVKVSQVVASKYPTLNGFVKTDLEIPVGGLGQLKPEQVVLDGVPYTRTLMARLAATPVRSGKLNVDSMGVNVTYLGEAQFDQDDILNLFQRMLPGTRTGSALSDLVAIEVEPLPTSGKPTSFSGGVGDFDVSSVVDRSEVKVGEPVTLTIKVEGRGNTAPLELPRLELPPGVDVFESKGRALPQKSALSSKVFEVVLIPRKTGEFAVPGVLFQFFSPSQGAYVSKGAPGFTLKVAENPNAPAQPAPGVQVGRLTGDPETSSRVSPEAPSSRLPEPAWETDGKTPLGVHRPSLWGRILQGSFDSASPLAILTLLLGAALGVRTAKAAWKVRRQNQPSLSEREIAANLAKSWKSLEAACDRAEKGAPWSEVAQTYEALTGAVFDSLDRRGAGGARALPRSEIRAALLDSGRATPEEWSRYEALLEYAETVRFAIQAGMVTEADARRALRRWITEGKTLDQSSPALRASL
jgi:hypothetical protein